MRSTSAFEGDQGNSADKIVNYCEINGVLQILRFIVPACVGEKAG